MINSEIIQSVEQQARIMETLNIKKYMEGVHDILKRKNFNFKNETYTTAKLVFQTIKSILNFHVSYIVGNPVTISGEETIVSAYNRIYKQGGFNKKDYDILSDIYSFGNAFEYLYLDVDNRLQSKIIRPEDSYPVYDERGCYIKFIEYWHDVTSGTEHQVVYYPNIVEVYNTESGKYSLTERYENHSGLPIHYKSGYKDSYSFYGVGIVKDLVPILDEIELLLSKMSDSIGTLSLNPIGVAIADRVEGSISKEVVGAVLNLESGGDFKYASATLDSPAIKLLLDNLINQLYAVAQVPSVVFGQSNIANVSEVSLKLLFAQTDNLAKQTALYFKEGLFSRFKHIEKLLLLQGISFQVEEFDSLDVVFNMNRPVDTSSLLNDLKTQCDIGAISIKSVVEQSPYTNDVVRELERIQGENKNVQ